jgi:hypothetical protein
MAAPARSQYDVIAPLRSSSSQLHGWCGMRARIREVGASVYQSDRSSLFVGVDVLTTRQCSLDNICPIHKHWRCCSCETSLGTTYIRQIHNKIHGFTLQFTIREYFLEQLCLELCMQHILVSAIFWLASILTVRYVVSPLNLLLLRQPTVNQRRP